MTAPFVVAGGIVRNRAWVLPRHLEAVGANGAHEYFYLTGDNNDDTERILRDDECAVLLHDTGEPGYTRDGSDGPRYRSAHMAAERNLWAAEALKRWPQATHLWVVDSDVLPAPDVLERLLALKAPVAAAFVPLADGVTPIHMIGWDAEKRQARRTGEEKLLTKPHVATLVGGCYLFTARFVDSNIDDLNFTTGESERWYRRPWGEHQQGEDGFFAAHARCNSGLPMLVDPLARCAHLMERDDR